MKRISLLGLCIFMPNLVGAVITSGFIHTPPPHIGSFDLSGSDFNVTGGFDEGSIWPPAVCPMGLGCAIGATIPVHGITSNSSFLTGTATIGEVTFSKVTWVDIHTTGSGWEVTGPSITLTGPGTYVVPFALTGQLCGVAFDSPPIFGIPCLVDLPNLTGNGLATIIVGTTIAFGETRLAVTDATFTFIAPEPSSFVLAGTALILIALQKYKWHRI